MDFTNIKISYVCRNIQYSKINEDPAFLEQYVPSAGDVGIFEVVSIGKHTKIQNAQLINQYLMVNDWVMCAFGNRYASSQFEGYVPLTPMEEYDLLGQGGVIGELRTLHTKYEETGPTKLKLVGMLNDCTESVVNTHQPLPVEMSLSQPYPSIILSIGSSMDSGKTTTAAYTIHGLSKAGLRTAFIKLTGTAYARDMRLASDLGAVSSLDFSYYGYPSTYMYPIEEIIHLFRTLIAESIKSDPQAIVVEIADGILQRETYGLLSNELFMAMIDDVILSGVDSLGLLGALQVLETLQITPTLLAGRVTCSPLLVKEVQDLCAIPVMNLHQLGDPQSILEILGINNLANSNLKRTNLAA